MSAETPSYFLIAINGGKVVEKTSKGILNNSADASNGAQRWTIEADAANNRKVAFKNVFNGQYLRAVTGAASGKVDTGSDKQWWTMEPGHAPGSVWLKCEDFRDAYLCNSWANHKDNNVVYSWPKQMNWVHSLLWYIRDAGELAEGFVPGSASAAAAGPSKLEVEDLKKREAEMKERQAALEAKEQKVKDLEQREAAVKKGEEDLEVEKAAQKKQADGASTEKAEELKKREAEVVAKEQKLKDLEQREAAMKEAEQEAEAQKAAQQKQADQLTAKEKEIAEKQSSRPGRDGEDTSGQQAELQKKVDELRKAEQDLAAKEAAMAKREQQSATKENELKEREAELARQKANPQPPGASVKELLQAENDNLKLQLKVKDLEKQLEEAKRPSKVTPPKIAANGQDRDHLAKLRDENARLKNLIAQQVRQKDKDKAGLTSDRPTSQTPNSANGTSVPSKATNPVRKENTSAASKTTTGPTKANTSAARGSASKALAPTINGAPKLRQPSTAAQTKGAPSPPDSARGTQHPSAAARADDSLPPPNGDAAELDRLQKQNARLQASNDKSRTTGAKPKAPSTSKQPSELERLRAENAALMQEQQDLAKGVKFVNGTKGGPGRGDDDTPSKAALSNASDPQAPCGHKGHEVTEEYNDGYKFDCGHYAHLPPRKLNKRMVGYLYEREG